MASVTRSPGIVVDDASIGISAWSSPGNATISDNVYSSAEVVDHFIDFGGTDVAIKIVKSNGVYGAQNKISLTVQDYISTTEAYKAYGGATDLWGEAWTPADINNSNFGVGYRASNQNDENYTHFLKATNFGFSIPTDATINGIIANIEKKYTYDGNYGNILVDHITITVYYTEGATTNTGNFFAFF